MTKKRPHLRASTTLALNVLADIGPGGATASVIAERMRPRPRCAAARLRWLKRGGLVRFIEHGAIWQLTDDSMFKKEQK